MRSADHNTTLLSAWLRRPRRSPLNRVLSDQRSSDRRRIAFHAMASRMNGFQLLDRTTSAPRLSSFQASPTVACDQKSDRGSRTDMDRWVDQTNSGATPNLSTKLDMA